MAPYKYCTNEMCDRACWCKRFTLYAKHRNDKDEQVPMVDYEHDCTAEHDYSCYMENKAREIWERDHRDGRYNVEPEQEEYQNYNRKSGMRENHEADIGITKTISGWDTSGEDSVLQLQRSGDRGSSIESFESFEDLYRYIVNDLKTREL